MALEYTTESRRVLKQLGFDVQQSKVNYRTILLLMLAYYLCSQSLVSVVYNWRNLIIRFQSLDSFVITCSSSLLFTQYAIDPGSVGGLLALADESYFQYQGLEISEQENKVKRKTIKEINSGARFVFKLLHYEGLAIVCTPVMYIIYMTLVTGQMEIQSIQIEELPLPIAYGQKCTNIFTYIIVFTTQLIFCYCAINVSICMYCSVMFAMRRVVSEVKMLTITIHRFDNQLNVVCNKYTSLDNNLKTILRQIIINQNFIYRKYKILNKKMEITITYINYVLTFVICFSIFSFIKVSNNLSRLKYCTQMVVSMMLLYVYSVNGQLLINEGEKIFESFAQFTWYDKPEWFKKSLLFMLTRAQKRLEVKPFGLYVIELRNFSVVINAAYSYFNVFKKFS